MSNRRHTSAVASRVKGVIFDLDGTLVDTLQDIADGLNSALRQGGLPEHDRATVRAWVGDGVSRLVERSLPLAKRQRAAAIEQEVRRHFDASPVSTARPYAGIEGLLAELRRRRLQLAVLSNKTHSIAVEVVRRLFRPQTFRCVRGLVDGGQRKPHPGAALKLLEELGLSSSETLLVGDSAVDITTASNAGMRSVAVSWGFRDRRQLESRRPTWLIDEPRQLLEILALSPSDE